MVEVVYMTTRPKIDLPTHVATRSSGTLSTILCEQITSVSVERVGHRIGQLTEAELSNLDTALAISLGIDFGNLNAEPVMREPSEEELAHMLRDRNGPFKPMLREGQPNHPTGD